MARSAATVWMAWVVSVFLRCILGDFGAATAPMGKSLNKPLAKRSARPACAAGSTLLSSAIKIASSVTWFALRLIRSIVRMTLWVALRSLEAYVWGAVLSAALVVVSMHVWATLVIAALRPMVPYIMAASHGMCYIMYTAMAIPTYAVELLMCWGINALTTAAYGLTAIYLVLPGWVSRLLASCLSVFVGATLSCLPRSSVEVPQGSVKADDGAAGIDNTDDSVDAVVFVTAGAETGEGSKACFSSPVEVDVGVSGEGYESVCEHETPAVGLSAEPSCVSVAADSCVSGSSSRLPSIDGSESCTGIDSRRSSRCSAASDCPVVVNKQSSPAVCSTASSLCIESVACSWRARDPGCQVPVPLAPPTFVLNVCLNGEVACGDGRWVRWVPHVAGAKWRDQIVYSVQMVERPDGSRLEVIDVVDHLIYRLGECGPAASADWEIAMAIIEAFEKW